MKPHLRLIHLIGVIVPRRLRADWRQEWQAELQHREAMLEEWDRLNWRMKFDLLVRSLGAFRDAIWMQSYRWEDDMIQDVRYGIRMMMKNPGFTVVAIITLSLGIGVNTTIFTYINAVMFRILKFQEPERVAFVWSASSASGVRNPVSIPDYLDWREQAQSFSELAAGTLATRTMMVNGEPERVSSALVTSNFFQVVGITPTMGRAFLPNEDEAETSSAALISHQYWQKHFGSDPNVINRTFTLDERPVTVIGIMPVGFRFVVEGDVWEMLTLDRVQANRDQRTLIVLGRLKPDMTVAQADAEMKSISGRIAQQWPDTNAGWSSMVNSAPDALIGPNGGIVFALLLGVVSAVLLIACANIASLQFARAAARQKEIAVRVAIGARRGRLIRQLLTESLLMALISGVLGLLLAVWGNQLINARYAESLELLNEAVIDGRVLAYTMTIAILSVLFFGLAPALKSTKPELREALKERGQGGAGNRSTARFRSTLVVAEISTALTLLTVAGLMIRTIIALERIEPGFDPNGLLTMRVSLPEKDYTVEQQRRDFFERAIDQVAAQPGIKSVGAITRLPLRGGGSNARRTIAIEGSPVIDTSERPRAIDLIVSPGYFETLGIPLQTGRQLSAQDREHSTRVGVISRTMADKFWPNGDSIGKRFRFESSIQNEDWITIVGIVGDVRNDDADQPPLPQVYLPYAQNAVDTMSLVIRTVGDPLDQVAPVRSSISAVDEKLPVYEVATMNRIFFDDLAGVRIIVELLVAFAALALILAAAGVYGVMSYSVAQRTGEIGIRMALGARRQDVLRLIVGQGGKLVLLGVVIGMAVSLVLAQALGSVLYGVSKTDPLTLIATSALLAFFALVACWIPARRATKIDPMIALRYE